LVVRRNQELRYHKRVKRNFCKKAIKWIRRRADLCLNSILLLVKEDLAFLMEVLVDYSKAKIEVALMM
jgi:hypothetical protein